MDGILSPTRWDLGSHVTLKLPSCGNGETADCVSCVAVTDGRRLPSSSRQRVQFNGTLTIDPVDRSADSGVYTCEARGQNNMAARQSLNLNVIGKISSSWANLLFFKIDWSS